MILKIQNVQFSPSCGGFPQIASQMTGDFKILAKALIVTYKLYG